MARASIDDLLQRAAGRRDPRAVADQPVTERGARYIDFLIPGLIGMNLMSGSMWGIGWVIVNMRVRKLLKRMLAAPMRRRHLLYAQGLARLLLIPFEVTVILLFARIAFDVRVSGSLLALAVLSVAGSASFAAIAILVASRAQNNETVSGLMNLVMMPMFVLSGVFFSATHFPDAMQPLINALPLTALNDSLRAVIVDGAGLAAVTRRWWSWRSGAWPRLPWACACFAGTERDCSGQQGNRVPRNQIVAQLSLWQKGGTRQHLR